MARSFNDILFHTLSACFTHSLHFFSHRWRNVIRYVIGVEGESRCGSLLLSICGVS